MTRPQAIGPHPAPLASDWTHRTLLLVACTISVLLGPQAHAEETGEAKADRLFREARQAEDRNEFAMAEAKYLDLLDQLPGIFGKSSAREVVVRRDLGRIHIARNELDKAASQFIAVDKILTEIHGKDSAKRVLALAGVADVLRLKGDVQSAKQILEACVTRCEEKNEYGVDTFVLAANSLAHVYSTEGRFQDARRLYAQCLQIHARLKGDSNAGTLQIAKNLGNALHWTGHYADARRILLRVLNEQRKQGEAAALDFAATCLDVGDLLTTLAVYDLAETIYLESIAIHEKAFPDGSLKTLAALTGLARLHQYRKHFEKAEMTCNRIETLLARMQLKESLDGIQFLSLRGLLWLAQKRYRESEACLREALSLCEKLAAPRFERVRAEHNLAYNLLQQERFEEALKHQEFANQGWESLLGRVHPYLIVGVGLSARILEAAGRTAEARAAYDTARRRSHIHAATVLPSLPAWSQIDYLMVQDFVPWHRALCFAARNPDDAELAMNAWEWLMNFKGMATRVRLQSQLIARSKASEESGELAAAEQQLARAQLSRLDTAEMSAEREQVDKKISELEKRRIVLAQRLRDFITSQTPPSEWISGPAVVKHLDSRQAFIDFARMERYRPEREESEGAFYAAFVTHGGRTHVVDLGDANKIDLLTRKVRTMLGDGVQRVDAIGYRDAEIEARSALADLANLVLAPVKIHTGNATEWIISPDGDLWTVPWCALPMEDGRYLVERIDVRTMISAIDLVPEATTTGADELGSAVVFANPDFSATQPESQQPTRSSPPDIKLGDVRRLPGTERDSRAAEELFRELYEEAPTMLTGAEANLAAFLAIRRPKAIAIATHGFFIPAPAPEQPLPPFQSGQLTGLAGTTEPLLRCGLLAAGCNDNGPARSQGIITGLDVLSLDLRGCRLVVLNTCESGLGDPVSGDGLTGLRQAFVVAGAKAVVANIWKIPDQATATLTARFAQRMRAGDSVERAIAHAQREMIAADRARRDGATHPHFWAAHTVTRSR